MDLCRGGEGVDDRCGAGYIGRSLTPAARSSHEISWWEMERYKVSAVGSTVIDHKAGLVVKAEEHSPLLTKKTI